MSLFHIWASASVMSDFTLFNKKNTPSDKDQIVHILIIASFFCYFDGCCHGINDFNIESLGSHGPHGAP